jgi:hypothetical protein
MIIHQGSGNLRMANGVIENRESGLIDIQSDGDWVYGGNNGPIINNAGTLRKSGGSDVTYFNFHWGHLKLNNTGTVESTSGTIDFWQGLQGTGGTVHVGAGAQVLLKGDSNITDASFTGPGIVRAPSGNHTLIGNCYSENFELNGGILMGTHVLSGIWHWSSGAFGLRSPYSDGGTTTFAEDCLLRVITDSDHTIDVRAVTNHGVIHHVGTGSVIIKDFSSFTNEVDGILVLDSVSQWIDPGSNFNKSPFINKGTIYETAASDTTFTFISFEDTGTHIAENAWIEDPNHGWIYMTGFGGSGYFIYDHATQTWAWIPYHHYPNMFLYGEGGFWAWFVEQTQSINRWWFTFGDTPGWLYEGDMLP